MNFEIIGEATKRISQDLRHKYPDVQWKRMAGFRDVLIHDYLKVDYDEVWGIVERNLPELKEQIEAILQELNN
ncbi:MAG: HepT-like ribonuclease domain-containing protein [Rivularia sp. (in: cyanobacteria)]